MFGEEAEGPVTKCHMSILNFIIKGKLSKGSWVMSGTICTLKGSWGAIRRGRKVTNIFIKSVR